MKKEVKVKTIFAALLFLFISVNAQEKYYTFSELKGMEDQSGNTHLFYRLFYSDSSEHSYETENSIYHLDLSNNTDTLFLFDGGGWNQIIDIHFTTIEDYEFWDKDPAKYIYCGIESVVDPVRIIKRFDQSSPSFSEMGITANLANLELGKQDDSLVVASAPNLIKSTDGGFTWADFSDVDSLKYLNIVSISPYTSEEMFFMYLGKDLWKTTNGGSTIKLVHQTDYSIPKLFYDKDSIHIYGVSLNRLIASDNRGDSLSWTERYLGSSSIFVSVDYSQSGKIYLAEGKRIYVSEDYGETFSEYKVLDRRIVGVYKKPDSDKLYAATKYNLYEITTDTIKVLKSHQPDPELAEYYPLSIGNKWVYSNSFCPFAQPCNHSMYTVEITGDTIMSNGLKYYIFKATNKSHEEIYFDRYNVEDATVRRFSYNEEYIVEELAAQVGDTLCATLSEIIEDNNCGRIFTEEINVSLFNNVFKKRKYEVRVVPGYEYSLVKGIGFYSHDEWGNDPGGSTRLKGCIINGILYGDTSLTGINDEQENQPTEFSLFQNFPNPFNPATKIRYTIPSKQFVILKVFDLLGREAATLVNEEKPAGEYEIEFNGSSLSSGIYFYQLKAGNSIFTKRMIYLK